MKTIYSLKFALIAFILVMGITKANAQCSVSITPTYNSNGNVSFNASITPTGPASYYWSYYTGASYVNAGPNTNYTYSSNGTYTVTLFAILGPSVAPTCSTVANVVITVTNALCPSGFNAAFTTTISGNTVNFASTSTGTTGSTTYLYNFGDGGSATTPNANHTYASNGSYLATLYISDGTCSDSVAQTINLCNINASFTYTNLAAPGNIGVQANIGQVPNYSYIWSWGDGSPNNSGPNSTANHTYAGNGNYLITLTVLNSSVAPTCSASTQQFVSVTSNSCNLNASFTYTNVGSAGQVNFSSTSTGTIANTIHKWNFNDGTGFFYGNPVSHNFANGGIHNVMLHLKDSMGNCVDSIIQQVNVTSSPCTANSNFTLMFSGTPQLWYAAPAYAGNVIAAQWSWGDGNVSNQLYTSHTYSTAGMYNICLTVTTSCGTSSTCSNYNIFRTINANANNNMAMVTINVVPQLVTGISNAVQENASVSLYPNPNNGTFKIDLSNVNSESVNISIYNVLGQEVYSASAKTVNGSLKSEISTNDLSSGTYYIQVKSDARSYNLKTVINK